MRQASKRVDAVELAPLIKLSGSAVAALITRSLELSKNVFFVVAASLGVAFISAILVARSKPDSAPRKRTACTETKRAKSKSANTHKKRTGSAIAASTKLAPRALFLDFINSGYRAQSNSARDILC